MNRNSLLSDSFHVGIEPFAQTHFILDKADTNQYDRYALLLETKEPVRVGYCPRYLSQDLFRVRQQAPICLTVENISPNAPLQFRLLCKAVFIPPDGFALYATEAHQPLAQEVKAA